MRATADEDVVEDSLRQYRTSLEALDYEGAAMAGERLSETDCSVCTRIGQHLTAMGVALSTSPHPETENALREQAIESAKRLESELV